MVNMSFHVHMFLKAVGGIITELVVSVTLQILTVFILLKKLVVSRGSQDCGIGVILLSLSKWNFESGTRNENNW